jgi:hypothetical protein
LVVHYFPNTNITRVRLFLHLKPTFCLNEFGLVEKSRKGVKAL